MLIRNACANLNYDFPTEYRSASPQKGLTLTRPAARFKFPIRQNEYLCTATKTTGPDETNRVWLRVEEKTRLTKRIERIFTVCPVLARRLTLEKAFRMKKKIRVLQNESFVLHLVVRAL